MTLTWTLDQRKNSHPKKCTHWKNRTSRPNILLSGVKPLPFVSGCMKDNVEVIHFHIKSRGAQGLVFVQITFEKYSTNFYFENGEVGVKTTIANL